MSEKCFSNNFSDLSQAVRDVRRELSLLGASGADAPSLEGEFTMPETPVGIAARGSAPIYPWGWIAYVWYRGSDGGKNGFLDAFFLNSMSDLVAMKADYESDANYPLYVFEWEHIWKLTGTFAGYEAHLEETDLWVAWQEARTQGLAMLAALAAVSAWLDEGGTVDKSELSAAVESLEAAFSKVKKWREH
jgi:hypothetical protein